MISLRIRTMLAFSALAILVGCANDPAAQTPAALPVEPAPVADDAAATVAARSSPMNLNPLTMIVDANGRRPINNATRADIRQALRALDPVDCPDGASYRDCLRKLGAKPNRFRGVSGLTARAFARAAQSLNNYGETTRPSVDIRGQIVQECLHDTSLPGYELTRVSGTPTKLRLCVYMETTVERPGGGDPAVRYQYFHIEVEDNIGIDDGTGGTPSNGWPAAAASTGLTVPQKAGFNYKLYAWGDKIRVKTYWEARRLENGAPKWNKFDAPPPRRPRINAFFEPDPDACVDMLFELAVPDTMPVGYSGGVDYCLGRCRNPPIVNTR